MLVQTNKEEFETFFFLNILLKHMIREMFDRGNVRLGKCLRGKCPVGEVSVGEVSGRGIFCSGKCPSGKCPLGKCQSGSVHGEVSVGELSAYLLFQGQKNDKKVTKKKLENMIKPYLIK